MTVTSILAIVAAPPHHIEVADNLSAGISIPVFQWGTQKSCKLGKDDVNAQPVSTMFLPPAAGEQMALSSDSIEDKPGGKGVASVMIHYIDNSGLEQTEVITLNGTIPVMTVAKNIQFINIMHTETPGGMGDPNDQCAAGLILIYSAANPAKVYCCIQPGKNIDDSSQFMVPSNKILAIETYDFSATHNVPVEIALRANSDLGLPHPKGVWFDQISICLQNSVIGRQLSVPFIIGPNAIVKATAFSDLQGATVNVVWVGSLLPVTPIVV